MADKRNQVQDGFPEAVLQFVSRHLESVERRQQRGRRLGRHARGARLALGILVGLGLIAFNVLVWGDFAHVPLVPGVGAETTTSPFRRGVGDRPSVTVTAAATPAPPPTTRPSRPERPKAAPPVGARGSLTVVLAAVRGDSWVTVRAGGPTGAVVYEGVIPEGQSTRVAGRRLWARFGSLGNLDVSVNGHPVAAARSGTLDAFITADGLDFDSAATG